MQPYFLPYIGYFQLLKTCDKFVIYDDAEYTKRGWINRNYFLQNGNPCLFSIPIKKDRDTLKIRQRVLADNFDPIALCRRFANAYRRSPQFHAFFPVLEKILLFEETNLFRFIHSSIIEIMDYLDIDTPIQLSSEIKIDPELRSELRVLAICQKMKASIYLNPIGGLDLYNSETFKKHGLELRFLNPTLSAYSQFKTPFIERLSIIDVLMFNSKEEVESMLLKDFQLMTV
ncbi:MAG: WbqC family protein [Candidatus Azotimanducaceae bacterium]